MGVWIYDEEDNWGLIEYFPEEKKVIVSHPSEFVQRVVTRYLTSKRQYALPEGGSCLSVPVGYMKPIEDVELLDIALNEMLSHIGLSTLHRTTFIRSVA